MPEPLRIVESTDLTRCELETFYDEILFSSFDYAELEDRAALIDALADPQSATPGSIALDAAGQIGGGIVADWFAHSRVLLISYLAARPESRGHGLGKQLIREVLPAWTLRFGADAVVAEVENPHFYRSDEQHGDPLARLRFYGGLGAKIVDNPYFQPALSAEQPRVRNLFLMILSASPSVMMNGTSVDAAPLSSFFQEYLAGTEGDVEDDEARTVLDGLRANDTIGLIDPVEFLKR